MRLPRAGLTVIAIVLYLAGVLYFLHPAGRFDSFPLDDGWIHQVYARAFAHGHGFEYNDGTQEAGATSPLWVIVTAPLHWFPDQKAQQAVGGTMLIGVLLALVGVVLFASTVKSVSGFPLTACVAASLFAVDPRLLFSSLSGMETMLVVALWLGGVRACLARLWFLAAVVFALMPLARPECLAVLPLVAVVLLISDRERSWPRRLLPVLLLGVPIALWSLFCHQTNGHWFPNTYYVKAHSFHLDGRIIANAWHIVAGQGFGMLFLFPVGLVVAAAGLWRRRRWTELLMMVVAPFVYVFSVAGTRELVTDGYYWTRWLDPAAVILTATFALGIAGVLTGAVSGISGRPARRTAVIAVGVVALGLCTPRFARSFVERHDRLKTDSRAIANMNVRSAEWIRDHTPENATVGVNNAGAVRYLANRRTIDLLGINDHELAFGHITREEAMLGCDWLVIVPLEFKPQEQLIRSHYTVATLIRVPIKEYTVCRCPMQATIGIFEKKIAP